MYITVSTKQTHWESWSRSTGQKIARLLWNPKYHYCVHIPPLDLILSQLNPVYTLTSLYDSSYYSSTLRSPKCLLPFRFSDYNFIWIYHVIHGCCMCHPSLSAWFDHPYNIWWNVSPQYAVFSNLPLIHPFCKYGVVTSAGCRPLGYFSTWTGSTRLWAGGGLPWGDQFRVSYSDFSWADIHLSPGL